MSSITKELPVWLNFWQKQKIFSSVPAVKSMPLLRKTFLATTESEFDRLMSERSQSNLPTVFPKSGFFLPKCQSEDYVGLYLDSHMCLHGLY